MDFFTIKGNEYVIQTRLDAFKQFFIVRKLSPLIAEIGGNLESVKANPVAFLKSVAGSLASLPEDDVNQILNTCLATVNRRQNGAWVRIMSSGGLMFDDIDMSAMVQIVTKVLSENLIDFFSELPGQVSGNQV